MCFTTLPTPGIINAIKYTKIIIITVIIGIVVFGILYILNIKDSNNDSKSISTSSKKEIILDDKFNILINSSVIGLGIYYPYAAKDILNFDRPTNPDLGAYQLQ